MKECLKIELESLPAKAIAYELLKDKKIEKKVFFALYYLIAMTLEGHQCVYVEKGGVTPSFEGMLGNQICEKELSEGFELFPSEMIQNEEVKDLRPIVKLDQNYYLQKYFLAETEFISHFIKIKEAAPLISFDLLDVKSRLDQAVLLNPEQKKAVETCFNQTISLLTGGPGTGKSFTAKELISVYCSLCNKKKIKPQILLCAPTGKATSSLKYKIKQDHSLEKYAIEVKTLHSALGIQGEEKKASKHLYGYDLVVVDECSMVDLFIWRELLASLRLGVRLFLMGDPFQLPPVESGMLFRDLANGYGCSSLKRCVRVESSRLLELGSFIKEKNIEAIKKQFVISDQELAYQELENEKNLFEIEKLYSHDHKEKGETQVFLTPMNFGVWGTKGISQWMLSKESCQKNRPDSVPLLVTKTAYDLELFNGDIGIIKNEIVYFTFDKETKEVPLSLIPAYEYAYALSIHKSQGSEYDHVVLLLPSGSERFGKELFYTAVTRAKKSLKIFAMPGVLEKILQVDATKYSAVAQRISKALNNKSA